MAFQPRLTRYARHQFDRLPLPVLDTLLDCINEIGDDPFRDSHLRVTLVIPLYRIFPGAYLCGDWAIAYQVDPPNTVLIEVVGQSFYRL